MIRDRLVIGIRDKQLGERMLDSPKLELKKAIDMCRQKEQLQQEARQIEQSSAMQVTEDADAVHQIRPRHAAANRYESQKFGKFQ